MKSTKQSSNTAENGNKSKPLLSSRLFFRTWISSQNYMAIQGTPDLETLQIFMFHYGNEENIMQFTGLKDKNGKEIYEGDILKTKFGNKIWFSDLIDYHLWNIQNSNAFSQIEVIGNIFENPELL